MRKCPNCRCSTPNPIDQPCLHCGHEGYITSWTGIGMLAMIAGPIVGGFLGNSVGGLLIDFRLATCLGIFIGLITGAMIFAAGTKG